MTSETPRTDAAERAAFSQRTECAMLSYRDLAQELECALSAALERERTARNDALEEAASFAWENTGHCCEDVAEKIRALKTAALDKKEKS